MIGSNERIAGLLLLASLVPFAVLAVLVIRGESPVVYGLFRPIEELTEHLPVSRWELTARASAYVLLLAGFGVLSVCLADSGDRSVPLIAFAMFLATTILQALEATFYQNINPWAATEAARTGTVPELFTALHGWMNYSLQIVYMTFGLLAMALFGWSFLRTGLLPRWAGWATLLWSLTWLIGTIVFQTTLPATLFVWPWVIGAVLLAVGRRSSPAFRSQSPVHGPSARG